MRQCFEPAQRKWPFQHLDGHYNPPHSSQVSLEFEYDYEKESGGSGSIYCGLYVCLLPWIYFPVQGLLNT